MNRFYRIPYIRCVSAPAAAWHSSLAVRNLSECQLLSKCRVNIHRITFGGRDSAAYAMQHSLKEDRKKTKGAVSQVRQVLLKFVKVVWASVPGEGLMTVGELRL